MHIVENSPYLLYAEDDADDQEILTEVITSINPGASVVSFDNGLKLMQYLKEIGDGAALPCAIVLDINMPVQDGIKTLQNIKSSEKFSEIPVFIFTNSSNPKDKLITTDLGARAFFTKPSLRAELIQIGKQLIESC